MVHSLSNHIMIIYSITLCSKHRVKISQSYRPQCYDVCRLRCGGRAGRINFNGVALRVCGSTSPDPMGWKMGWEDMGEALEGSGKSDPSVLTSVA